MNHTKSIYILEGMLFVICLGMIMVLVNDPVIKLILLIIITILQLLTMTCLKNINNSVNNLIESLCDSLDNICNNDSCKFDLYNETVESKIQYKLQRLYTTIEQTKNESLYQKKVLQSLITDISHQIKAPITNIKLYSELLGKEDLTTDEHQQFITMLTLQIDKLEFLIQSLIKMSRLENDIVKLVIGENLISDTVLKALQDVFYQSEIKEIEIKLCGDLQLKAHFDPKWTQEAITNILDNAIKYSAHHTIIDINITKNEFYAKVSISDQGQGIPQANINNIFKRFYRGPNNNCNQGIGVGLYLSREIIFKQQGYITVASSIGQGSIFTIYLPL